MGTIRQRSNGSFELRVTHRNLPKPYYATLDSYEQAERYAAKLKASLDRGHVPPELQAEPVAPKLPLSVLLRDYLARGRIAESDRPLVCWLQENLDVTVQGITERWVDDWILGMKRKEHLAPGTIRKRVESLARAVDWWVRDTQQRNWVNPLRTLPRGYASYADGEAPEGMGKRVDQSRDRRLLPGEGERFEAAILGWKNPDRQRPLDMPDRDDFLLLYRTIVNTGLRLREAFTLTWEQIDLENRLIRVVKSKTGAAREVPMIPSVYGWFLETHSAKPRDPRATVFGFWNGGPEDLKKTTTRLSYRFRTLFEYCGVDDLTEHDLRHEATCRWMLLKDESGRWLFRPEEVRRITGHKSVQVFERYLSLRGADLTERLWQRRESAGPS